MMISFLKHARTLFVAAIVLAIPVYAVFTVASGTLFATVALADEDDPISNGLKIVNRRTARPQANASKAGGESDVVLLEDWVFTDKGNQSPYN
jgi:hypothetical protein